LNRAIIFRPAALQDLAEIWVYSAQNRGADQADIYIREIHSVLAKVAGNPALGSPQDHVQHGLRKMTAAFHVVYHFHDDRIVRVSRILHPAMDVGAAISDAK
jgi:toxin ParE1/3/4